MKKFFVSRRILPGIVIVLAIVAFGSVAALNIFSNKAGAQPAAPTTTPVTPTPTPLPLPNDIPAYQSSNSSTTQPVGETVSITTPAGTRSGSGWVYTVQTGGTPATVAAFYTTQMPQQGWQAQDVPLRKGPTDYVGTYTKGNVTCLIEDQDVQGEIQVTILEYTA